MLSLVALRMLLLGNIFGLGAGICLSFVGVSEAFEVGISH